MFCSQCGSKNEDSAKFCGGCGCNLNSGAPSPAAAPAINASNQGQAGDMIMPTVPPKSAGLAAFLSFLLCGLGQFYLGQRMKFIAALVACFLLFMTGPLAILSGIIWIVMIFDAFFIGKKLESGTPVKQWQFF
jgi:TM2 domain-containing membrane protein YozV